jgi:hypothetical protein
VKYRPNPPTPFPTREGGKPLSLQERGLGIGQSVPHQNENRTPFRLPLIDRTPQFGNKRSLEKIRL